jgi:hypothetical protein
MSIKIPLEDLIDIKPFDQDVPVQYQSYQMARGYIASGRCSLKNIPERFIDDDLRLLAVSVGADSIFGSLATESFKLITPSQSERYEEIALLSIKQDCRNARHVDSTVMNNDFMKKALAVNGEALIPFLKSSAHSSKINLTQELIDLAVSSSPTYLKFDAFRPDQYLAEAVSQLIKNHKFNLPILLKLGHFTTLVEVIKEGSWPNHFPEKPSNLKAGIDTMMSQPEDRILVYRAYVMSYPIADVVALMSNPHYRPELLNMYSRAELEPFLKGGPLAEDREFKGRLLENEMGL